MNHGTVIIGGGPAGLQLAYFLQKAGRDYVILEKDSTAGATFSSYPRHRTLISINKVFTGESNPDKNLRWDWNSLLTDPEDSKKHPVFAKYTRDYFPSADVMVKYLSDFAKNFKLNIAYDTEITNLSKKGETFTLKTSSGKVYTTGVVVVATGFRKTNMPPIEGIELAQKYETMNINPADYKNQEVLIIGKGNSGFETADNLIATTALIHICSPSPVQLAWKTHYIGHLRAINNDLLDTYQLKSQNAVLDAKIKSIEKNPKTGRFDVTLLYEHALGEKETLHYDAVFNCTGFVTDTGFYDKSCTPELVHDGRFPAMKSDWESTNIKNLFYAGVLSHSLDYKKHTSGFIHGFRYCCRTLFHLLEQRFHGVPFPRKEIPATVDAVVDAIISRADTTSALWQQFGYMTDVITIQDNKAYYYEELTTGLVKDSDLSTFPHYYTFSLEFNEVEGDPFAIDRAPKPEQAENSVFLHPVVRQWNKGKLMNEIHILEDLFTNWNDPVNHIQPLREFVTYCFQGRVGFKVRPMKAKM